MTRAFRKTILLAFVSSACADMTGPATDPDNPDGPGDPGNPDNPDHPTQPDQLTVQLAPRSGISGMQRVNFAVPLVSGKLSDPANVRVFASGTEIASGRRVLAKYPDGSARSIQLQVEVDVSTTTTLDVALGVAATADLALVAVSTTLDPSDGTAGPRVWARLPAAWLSASGVAGPQLPQAEMTGALATAWSSVCDYADNNVDAFLALEASRDVWLYDRGTTMYRGHARQGDQVTLESGYRETAIYRAGITGTGAATRIGVPTADADLKYHYTQNLAIHYLLTGDDRFRESAEDVATRVRALWGDGSYGGDDDFWTERHAGFGLLAYLWTSIVSDDRAAEFAGLADAAFDSAMLVPAIFGSWDDPNARCFGHTATAHAEDYGTWGCSPWMSAIVADALDAYAGERTGARTTAAHTAIVQLGTVIARDGLDGDGRPFYWLALDGASEVDEYDEHWGESAYVAAMAWHRGGRTDPALRATVDDLIAGLASNGSSPHLRSFNWQCRSAVATAWYLR